MSKMPSLNRHRDRNVPLIRRGPSSAPAREASGVRELTDSTENRSALKPRPRDGIDLLLLTCCSPRASMSAVPVSFWPRRPTGLRPKSRLWGKHRAFILLGPNRGRAHHFRRRKGIDSGGIRSMSKMTAILAGCVAASVISFGAQAFSPAPMPIRAVPDVTPVADYCGPGFHSVPYGGCEPNPAPAVEAPRHYLEGPLFGIPYAEPPRIGLPWLALCEPAGCRPALSGPPGSGLAARLPVWLHLFFPFRPLRADLSVNWGDACSSGNPDRT